MESSDTRAENKDLRARKRSPSVGRQAVFPSKGFGDDRGVRKEGRECESVRVNERKREKMSERAQEGRRR